MTTTKQLLRIRLAVRAVLVLGVAASLAANVLHAPDNPISRTISAWPPVALLLTVELVSRVPVHRRGLGAVRITATSVIAGIAAWVSYWHMVAVSAHYGETGVSPYLLPLSVDGLVVVASVSLVELGGQIRERTADIADLQQDMSAPDTDTADTADTDTAEPDVLPLHVVRQDDRPSPRRPRKVVLPDAASAALELRRTNPAMTQEAIAEAVGRSVRQVRRYLRETAEVTA